MPASDLSTAELVERSSDLHDLRAELLALVQAVEDNPKPADVRAALDALRERILATAA